MKKKETNDVSIEDVKTKVRTALEKKYGSVSSFLESEQGKKFGGIKCRPYLYETGAVSYPFLKDLCSFLGLGELVRSFRVTRTITYELKKGDK